MFRAFRFLQPHLKIPHCTIPNTLLQFKQLLQDCLQYDTVKRDAYSTYNCDPINTRERILETELPVTPRLGETQK